MIQRYRDQDTMNNMAVNNSRLQGFYKLSVSERRSLLAEIANLNEEQVSAWSKTGELSESRAD